MASLSGPRHAQGFQLAEFCDLILYQLPIGVFYGVDANGHDKRSKVAKFLDVLDPVEYLRARGVNAIQLMPIQECPSQTSMCDNGVDLPISSNASSTSFI